MRQPQKPGLKCSREFLSSHQKLLRNVFIPIDKKDIYHVSPHGPTWKKMKCTHQKHFLFSALAPLSVIDLLGRLRFSLISADTILLEVACIPSQKF